MKIKSIFTVMLLVIILAFSSVFAQTYNYEEMTQEQYNTYLAEWQQRLQTAQSGIDGENTEIDALKKELDTLQGEIDGEWDAMYTAASADQPAFNSYGESLNGLKSDAASMLNMTPEEIYSKSGEVDELQARLDEAKKNHFSATSDNTAEVNAIQSLIDQIKAKGAAAIPPSYTVVRGDYLWKIAAKEDIYGDAYAWMRIYTSNKDQIKDPNMIFPNQVFTIDHQVGADQHLVVKGENLSKIAGYSNVYGSAFKWQKLYEANKNTISDPSVIFPYQVLKIAR